MLVLPKYCAKTLRDLTFLSDFEQLSLERATFGEITGTFLGNLKQLVESPIWGCAPKEKFEILIALTLRGQGCRQKLHCTYPNLPIGAG